MTTFPFNLPAVITEPPKPKAPLAYVPPPPRPGVPQGQLTYAEKIKLLNQQIAERVEGIMKGLAIKAAALKQ